MKSIEESDEKMSISLSLKIRFSRNIVHKRNIYILLDKSKKLDCYFQRYYKISNFLPIVANGRANFILLVLWYCMKCRYSVLAPDPLLYKYIFNAKLYINITYKTTYNVIWIIMVIECVIKTNSNRSGPTAMKLLIFCLRDMKHRIA